jgi:hypothetical protein
MICLALGSFELFWGVFIKFLPVKLFQCVSFDEKAKDHEQPSGIVGKLKASTVRRKENIQKDLGADLRRRVEEMKKKQAAQGGNLSIQ